MIILCFLYFLHSMTSSPFSADLKCHWLHDVSVTRWLVFKWLRKEGREYRAGLLSLWSLNGCCRLQGGHRRSCLAPSIPVLPYFNTNYPCGTVFCTACFPEMAPLDILEQETTVFVGFWFTAETPWRFILVLPKFQPRLLVCLFACWVRVRVQTIWEQQPLVSRGVAQASNIANGVRA